jgi:hypothetical protein
VRISNVNAWATRRVELSERTVLLLGLAAGAVLRAVQIATSIGSVDAYFWTRHVELVEKYGVFDAYRVAKVLNHPPFALEIALWTKRLGALAGIQFFDSFRVLQGVADVVTALALLRLARRVSWDRPVWVALLFYLSPATIFISAFHCNSDPLMMMFLVLAIVCVVEERPLAGGLLIGAAVGIKIIALAALPLLFLACRGRKARALFAAAAAVTGAIIFVPAIAATGWVVIRNIFGYTGWRGGWGLPLVADILRDAVPNLFRGDSARFVTPLLIGALLALWAGEAWRTFRHGERAQARLIRVTGLAFLLVLFFATGFMPHYFFWFLPFLGFLFARRPVLILHALLSLFLFGLYTSWAGEWPWVYAPGGHNSPAVGMFGLVAWIAIGIAAAATVRSLYAKT